MGKNGHKKSRPGRCAKFEYQLSADGQGFSGRITESGVSDSFKMRVPVYVEFGKGGIKLGSANVTGNASIDLKDIKNWPTFEESCNLRDG